MVVDWVGMTAAQLVCQWVELLVGLLDDCLVEMMAEKMVDSLASLMVGLKVVW